MSGYQIAKKNAASCDSLENMISWISKKKQITSAGVWTIDNDSFVINIVRVRTTTFCWSQAFSGPLFLCHNKLTRVRYDYSTSQDGDGEMLL